ncbi:MAG: peptidylprolyl isomerase [Oscillospiraceae bacterium]|nr:peptidylprolyl isomerase [Oscillospiraceae bacterium]
MKKKSIISMLLAVIMMCTLFTGCGSDPVLKVGDREFDEDTYCAAVAYADLVAQQNEGISYAQSLEQEFEGKKGIDILKEQAEDLLKQMEASRKLANDKGIKLTDEDKKALEDQKTQEVESMGGRKVFIEDLEAQGFNEEFYDYVQESIYLYSKYQNEVAASFDISTEDVLRYVENGEFIRVKHVLVMPAEDGSDVEEKKALAEEIAARAAKGEDFDALIKDYGADPGMESAPHGYIIDQSGNTPSGSGMVAEFTQASVALEVGGVSAPVQTDYGFHIIKRYSLDAADIEDTSVGIPKSETNPEDVTIGELIKSEFMEGAFQVSLMEAIEEAKESIAVEKLDGFDDVDFHEFFADVKEKQESLSHEGHNHQ